MTLEVDKRSVGGEGRRIFSFLISSVPKVIHVNLNS
jgi:hypothetical protein